MGHAIKNLYQAKTELSSLVDRAARGEEFIIAKSGVPMARLVPISRQGHRRPPGCWKGKVFIAEDFDHLDGVDLALWEGAEAKPARKRPRKTR